MRDSTAMRRWLARPQAKRAAVLICLLPALGLIYATVADELGANPVEALQHSSGLWALRFLCLTLAITPLRIHAALPELARFRRTFGLATFGYACLHVLTYAALDMRFDWSGIGADVLERPFMFVGALAWLLLLALALTSFGGAMRWLGAPRWRALHRSVYLVAGLALLHFYWMRAGKNDFAEVWPYAGVIAVLLLDRLVRWGRRCWTARVPDAKAIRAATGRRASRAGE